MNNRRAVLLLCSLLPLLAACESLPSWMGGSKKPIERLPGDRAAILPVGADLKADETLATLVVKLPPPVSKSDWAQAGEVASADGNLAAGALTQRRETGIGEGNAFEYSLPVRPVVAAGKVFVMDGAGYISAHDAADIEKRLWQSAGLSEKHDPEIIGGGLAFAGGKLYAASGRGVIAAYDAETGQELWKKKLGLPFRSPPRVAGDRLFLVTIDSQTYALSAASGEVLWMHRGINEIGAIMNAVSPAVRGDVLFAPYVSGEIYALSMANGQELWSEALGASKKTQADGVFAGVGGDPVVDGDVLIAVGSGGGLSVFAAATGQRLWDRPIASFNSPWIAGDYLYVLAADNTLTCFVKYNGRIRWSTKLQSFGDEERKIYPYLWRGPVMADGKLYVAGSHGEMAVVSAADGSIVEMREIPEGIAAAPVIAAGRMYLVGKDAELYAFQ